MTGKEFLNNITPKHNTSDARGGHHIALVIGTVTEIGAGFAEFALHNPELALGQAVAGLAAFALARRRHNDAKRLAKIEKEMQENPPWHKKFRNIQDGFHKESLVNQFNDACEYLSDLDNFDPEEFRVVLQTDGGRIARCTFMRIEEVPADTIRITESAVCAQRVEVYEIVEDRDSGIDDFRLLFFAQASKSWSYKLRYFDIEDREITYLEHLNIADKLTHHVTLQAAHKQQERLKNPES